MCKNIKKIIAIVLVASAFSAVTPATNINLLTTKTYAATNDKSELSSLDLLDESGNEIKLYDGALSRRQLRLILSGKMKPQDANELKALFTEKDK